MSLSIVKLPTLWIVQDTDADNTVEKDVCAGPCRLLHVQVTNPNNPSELAYLKLFNKANPILGTDAPDEIIECPGSNVASAAGGLAQVTDVPIHPPKGLLFSNGLSFACTVEPGTAGTTTPTLNVAVTLQVQPGSD